MPFTGGNEFTVNQFTTRNQTTSSTNNLTDSVVNERSMQSIGMDANGNMVVTWSSLGQDVTSEVDNWGVYARRYDATTGQWGSEFIVNPGPASAAGLRSGNQLASTVAVDDEGDFIITWSSSSYYQDDGGGYGIYAQRYNRNGTVAGDPFRINATTVSDQADSSIATDADGDFVVTWTSRNQDGDRRGIYARRYSKDGTPISGEILVNTYTTNEQIHSSVAMDGTGNFVVVWESDGQPGDESWGIYAQRFNADGTKRGSEFRVNTYTTNTQRNASVSMDTTGNFVVTWTSNRGTAGGGEGEEIYAQRYDVTGAAIGTEFRVNQTTAGSQQHSQVKMLKTGGFIVTWTGTDSAGTGIWGRRYGANGQPLAGADGNEFLINTTGSGNQNFAAVGVDQTGNFAVSWASDQSGNNDVYNRIFTITQTANNPPTDIQLSNNTISENVADNSLIGRLSSVDPDGDTAFVYTFATGTGDTDNAAFTIVENNGVAELRIKNSPDFETKPTYSIRVRTTDSNGLIFEKVLAVAITNLNEAPTDLSIDKSTVNENVPLGTVVGNFSTIDPDANNNFAYALVPGVGSTDNAAFTIVGDELRVNSALNFEAKSTYAIRVQSTDQNGELIQKQLTISVANVNEAPTNIVLSKDNIDENAPANSVIGTLSAVDPDAGDTFSYALVAGTGGTDNAAFTIVSNNGVAELRINNSPDFETKPTYSILVRATDKAGLSFNKVFTVKINNLNDPPTNAAPTNLNLAPSSVNENVAAGTGVGNFATTDANAGDTFTYSLVTGTGDTDNTAFTIVGNQLRIIASPDFETKPTYAIRVRTTDQGGLSFERALTVAVANLNEAPTDIILNPDSINENVPAGSLVANLQTIDSDQSETFTYALIAGIGSTDNAAFTLSPTGQLTINSSPNFELKSAYAIRVRVTDKGGTSIEKALVVNINDVPEAGSPTDLTLSNSSINENSPANSTIGNLITTDNTAGPFVYTLDSNFGDGAQFIINANNQLVLKSIPDFEVKPTYNVRVKTTDPDGLSLTKVLTVVVNNVNEKPTDLALSATIIDENKPANSIVGSFSTTDPDANDSFTYTLIAGVGGTDNAAFTIVNNQLQINNSPNFEVKPAYSIRVRTADKGGEVFEKVFTINVRNVGETPTDIALSANTIDENKPASTVVGTFSTTDGDVSDTFTYALVAGTGSTDNASFAIVNNQLQIKSPPNFETKPSYSIRVQTTDKDGLPFQKVFVITVKDLNETPLDFNLSATTIDENKPAESIVGAFNTIDSDSNDTFTYALVAGTGSTDNAAFTIVNNQLQIKASPDFETKPSYSIRVKTTDSKGLSIEKSFTIAVNNLPETPGSTAPQDIRLSNNIIDENKPANSVIGALSTVDPDQNDTFTYSLVGGTGATDNAAFKIVNNQLQINNIPDYETKPSYSIRVRTTDKGGLTFEKVFAITVKNLAETPGTTTPQDILLSSSTIEENKPANSIVGLLSTTDPDQGDVFTYSLVAGAGGTDNAAFTIVNNELRLKNSPDFETKPSYSIRVQTRDVGGLLLEKVFTITVKDLVESPGTTPPRDLLLSNSRIDENKLPGTAIGTFSTIDPDQSETFTYSLVTGAGSTDNAAFTIVNNELRINNYADFETKSSYSIRVRTSDKGGLPFEKVFTIGVNDLSETPGTTPPRDFLLSNSSIDENKPANSFIGAFSTIDPDKGDTFTYSLVAGAGSTDNAAFTIVNNELRLKNSPDFETKSSYSIRVQTSDVGGLTLSKAFTITVKDLPELPGQTDPTDLLLSKTTVNENVPVDTLVGNFSTIDPDKNDTFTYSLAPGGDNNSFRIVGNELRISTSPDFEVKPSYLIRVTTTDAGGRSFTKDLTITVTNTNDPPVITPSAGALAYQEGSGAVVIDTGVGITDLDSTTLVGAEVRILGYVPGQDRLSLASQNGITANFDAATGVLTLAGNASLNNYQQAFRSITYLNSSNNPNTATRTIQFTARDATSTSRAANRAIQIIPLDTAPTVTTSAGNLAYIENSGDVAIDAGILVNDPDSSTLTGATVQLTGYIAGEDQLSVTTQNGISSNFDAATGTLTLFGAASPSSYQAALRSLTYLNTSGQPNTGLRTVRISVRDGSVLSNTATRSIQVTPIDSAPVVRTSSGGLSYRENSGKAIIDPQISVVDVDSATLTGATIRLQNYRAGQDSLSVTATAGISSSFDAANGVLTLTGTATVATYESLLRSVSYINSSDNPASTARTAQFTVRDATAASNLGSREIQIIPSNDLPQIKTSAAQVTFTQGSVLIDPNLELTDVDSPRLTNATIAIGNYVAGEDNLLFKDQNGITGNFDQVRGVLQLSGSAAVVSYQTALRSIRFGNNRAIPTATPRNLQIRVSDGVATSNPDSGRINIQFNLTGEVPTIDLNGTGTGVDYGNTFIESGPPVAVVASDARFTNQAYPVLTSAQVRIVNLLNGASEQLTANSVGTGITTVYDANTGILSLTGRAALADYLQVLRSVTYVNSDPGIDTTTRTLLFTVSNGTTTSLPAQTRVQISQIKVGNGTIGTDGSLVTTPATDLINAYASDDSVVSILSNLQQNDSINGGAGRDTFTLQDGGGAIVIDVDNPANQMWGVLTNNTLVSGFEVFRLTGFAGTATLLGSEFRDDTLVGGLGNDLVLGKSGNDVLGGNAGDDTLDGGFGDDQLEGRLGDDIYVVDSRSDLVIEGLNQGYDTVQTTVSLTLSNNVEALTLLAGATAGNGNQLDNLIMGSQLSNRLGGETGNDVLVGEDGKDVLIGGNGNDRLEGGRGRDQISGGRGKDIFRLTQARPGSRDVIRDFQRVDQIEIERSGFSNKLKLGKVRANQFRVGTSAVDQSDRFIYNRATGIFSFDADGLGGASQVQIAKFSNKAGLNRADLFVVDT